MILETVKFSNKSEKPSTLYHLIGNMIICDSLYLQIKSEENDRIKSEFLRQTIDYFLEPKDGDYGL